MNENSFTDEDGDTYEVTRDVTRVGETDTINLWLTFSGSANRDEFMSFYAKDANRIIALIAKAIE